MKNTPEEDAIFAEYRSDRMERSGIVTLVSIALFCVLATSLVFLLSSHSSGLLWWFEFGFIAGLFYFACVFVPRRWFGKQCDHCGSRRWKQRIGKELLNEREGQARRTTGSQSTATVDGKNVTVSNSTRQIVPVIRQLWRIDYKCRDCGSQISRVREEIIDEF